ncbi:unnamed protein product, partial [Oncorhynchus mykiss]
MILAVFFAQIHPHYLSKQWQRLRSVLFCSVAGYGLIPTVHWVWLNGGFSSDLVQGWFPGHGLKPLVLDTVICSVEDLKLTLQSFIPRVLGMYAIAAVAFVFYVSKVPERYFPGSPLTTFHFFPSLYLHPLASPCTLPLASPCTLPLASPCTSSRLSLHLPLASPCTSSRLSLHLLSPS